MVFDVVATEIVGEREVAETDEFCVHGLAEDTKVRVHLELIYSDSWEIRGKDAIKALDRPPLYTLGNG